MANATEISAWVIRERRSCSTAASTAGDVLLATVFGADDRSVIGSPSTKRTTHTSTVLTVTR